MRQMCYGIRIPHESAVIQPQDGTELPDTIAHGFLESQVRPVSGNKCSFWLNALPANLPTIKFQRDKKKCMKRVPSKGGREY